MANSIGFGEHVKSTLFSGVMWASYGLVVGSAAGYIGTALKVSKTFNFMNLGLATAAGFATNALLQYVFSQIDCIQTTAWLKALVHAIAIPVISMLTAMYVMNTYASMTVYTLAVVAAGTFILANMLHPNPQMQKPLHA